MNRLEYLSQAHQFAKRGNDLPHAKLNQEIVRAIRKNIKGKTAREWANELGVHIRTIEAVQSYKNWRNV